MKMFTTLEKIGIICLSIVGFRVVRSIVRYMYRSVIGPALGFGVNFKKMGRWAVITGATDGVGKAYAEELAKRGLDIVLISRSPFKLENVATEIESKFGVQTKTIDVNFTGGIEIYQRIEKELNDLEVGVLVNNVGMSYSNPEYFLQLPDKEQMIQNLIACNILSVTMMTQVVMPQMLERKKGVVINIGSAAGIIPNPLLSVYSATKAFVSKFSEDLHSEYNNKGIIIQCILPGFVATNMSKMRRATWMAPSPQTFVRSALKTVGFYDATTGYAAHDIMVFVIHLVQSISPSLAVWVIFRNLDALRRRAHRKTLK